MLSLETISQLALQVRIPLSSSGHLCTTAFQTRFLLSTLLDLAGYRFASAQRAAFFDAASNEYQNWARNCGAAKQGEDAYKTAVQRLEVLLCCPYPAGNGVTNEHVAERAKQGRSQITYVLAEDIDYDKLSHSRIFLHSKPAPLIAEAVLRVYAELNGEKVGYWNVTAPLGSGVHSAWDPRDSDG